MTRWQHAKLPLLHHSRPSSYSYFFPQISLDSGDTSVLVEGHAAALPTSNTGPDASCIANRSSIATSPKDSNIFVTAAHDGFLRKWSVDGHRLLAKLAVGAADGAACSGIASVAGAGIGALEWASGGSFLACGLASGDVVLVYPGDMVMLSRQDPARYPWSNDIHVWHPCTKYPLVKKPDVVSVRRICQGLHRSAARQQATDLFQILFRVHGIVGGITTVALSTNRFCVVFGHKYLYRCPSDKKPKSAVTAVALSLNEASLTVGCDDGSLHGMKISQNGASVQHAWSSASVGASVLAMDVSEDGQVRNTISCFSGKRMPCRTGCHPPDPT